MSNVPFDCRYSKILEKNPREIVLLRGNGCKWRRCRFCDYHTDFSLDEQANFQLNSKVLAQVTGEFGRLEVINSGSFCDLNDATISLLLDLCMTQKITTVYFECHWMHRELIADFKKIYTSISIEEANLQLEAFETKYEKQQKIVKKVQDFMQYLEPLFELPMEIRK